MELLWLCICASFCLFIFVFLFSIILLHSQEWNYCVIVYLTIKSPPKFLMDVVFYIPATMTEDYDFSVLYQQWLFLVYLLFSWYRLITTMQFYFAFLKWSGASFENIFIKYKCLHVVLSVTYSHIWPMFLKFFCWYILLLQYMETTNWSNWVHRHVLPFIISVFRALQQWLKHTIAYCEPTYHSLI